jgi:hypothetical protein
MRQAYAHQAELRVPPQADENAPGAAITVALCGHGDHEPPCPLAPHYSEATREGDTVRLRILFATEPNRVDEVRSRIDGALSGGDWHLVGSGCRKIEAEERDHARRLLKNR